uniref:Uncharacterized protein n=1 Tax=Nelumbo nucifera TaxID=4432 RepID=A0A822YY06_NELNU|nr:TPA_asm: hypothetical protein HUJ06_008031 [Nelumbo nucifera]
MHIQQLAHHTSETESVKDGRVSIQTKAIVSPLNSNMGNHKKRILSTF